MMGFDDYIQPFATANGTEILKGVNYASGGAGILNETGQTAVVTLTQLFFCLALLFRYIPFFVSPLCQSSTLTYNYNDSDECDKNFSTRVLASAWMNS